MSESSSASSNTNATNGAINQSASLSSTTGTSTSTQKTGLGNTPFNQAAASSTIIHSLESLKELDPKMYNQWLVLFAQSLITYGQQYERRVEDAMKHLRDGEES